MRRYLAPGSTKRPSLRRLVEFSMLQVVAAMASAAGQLVFLVLIARWYDTQVVGAYGIAIGFIAVFTALTGAGMSPIIYRETAAEESHGFRLMTLAVTWRSYLIPGLIGIAAGVFVLTGAEAGCFWLVVLGGITNYVTEPATAHLNGLGRFRETAAATLVQRVVGVVILAGLSLDDSSGWRVGVSYAVASTSTSVWLGSLALRGHRVALTTQGLSSLIAKSWPLALSAVGDSVVLRASTLLLGLVAGAAAVGKFTPVAGIVFGVGGIMYSAIYPAIAVIGSSYSAGMRTRLMRYTPVLVGSVLVVVVSVQPVIDTIYRILFGVSAEEDVLLSARLLVLALAPLCGTLWLILILQCERKYQRVALPALFGICSLLGPGVYLMAKYSVAGAGAAGLFTECVRFSTAVWAVHWRGRKTKIANS